MKQQNRWLLGCLVIALLLSVAPAMAGWTDKTAAWTAQGLGGGGGFVTDTSTNTLYYLRGTSIKAYDPATDTWIGKTSATGLPGYSTSAPVWYANGKILVGPTHNAQLSLNVQTYDVLGDSWSQSIHPDATAGYGQGAVYNSVNNLLYVFHTVQATATNDYASYDPSTGTWSAQAVFPFVGAPMQTLSWSRMQSVVLDGVNYGMSELTNNTVGRVIFMNKVTLTSDDSFISGTVTQTPTHDLGVGNALYVISDAGSPFGDQAMAVKGTDIYVTGMGTSGVLAVYHTLTDTWEDLPSFTNPTGGDRDHVSAIAGSTLFVEDGGSFFTYSILLGDTNNDGVVDVVDLNNVFNNLGTAGPLGDTDANGVVDVNDLNNVFNNLGTVAAVGGEVPEPATLSLLVLGGLAMLSRRKK